MARAQQQSVSAVTVWMIVFVVLWLISTVMLVWLYTYQEGLRTDRKAALDRYNKAVHSSEEQSIDLLKSASDRPGETMVGLIEAARSQTAELASGSPDDVPGAISEKRDAVLERIADEARVPDKERYTKVSLLTGLDRLYEDYSATHQRLLDSEKRAGELDAKVAELTQNLAQQKEDFDLRTREQSARVEAVEKDRATFGTGRDAELESVRKAEEERRTLSDQDLTAAREALAERDSELAELQDRYYTLAEKCGAVQISPQPLATARQPDGVVLTALVGDPVVYINLGRKDRMTLGLEFAVYSSLTGIPTDGKSKARIEVVSISESTSECKVTALHGNEVILAGDLIANPIYDRDRPLTFYVLGEFDLNRDGEAEATGAATIESLIKEWGGQVVSEMTALTDFVVLGAAPRRPRAARTDAAQTPENEAISRAFEAYDTDLRLAQSLALPMLTQDVFLQFLGYTRRMPIVR